MQFAYYSTCRRVGFLPRLHSNGSVKIGYTEVTQPLVFFWSFRGYVTSLLGGPQCSDRVVRVHLIPGIEVSRPIEASSRPHRGLIEASVEAKHRGWQKLSRLSLGVWCDCIEASRLGHLEARVSTASTRASIEATSSYIEATWRLVG